MMISRIAQTALVLSGMGVMLALPAQAQQVVMTPEGTAFQVMPTVDPSNAMIAPTLPVIIGDGKVTPLPGFDEFPPIVPGSDRTSPGSPFAPILLVEDPGSVRIGGENGVLLRDAKLTNTPEKPLRRLTEAEEREGIFFTTSASAIRSSTVQIIPNQNLRMLNRKGNGNISPLSTSRILPFPLR
jgi:hypothetical protein